MSTHINLIASTLHCPVARAPCVRAWHLQFLLTQRILLSVAAVRLCLNATWNMHENLSVPESRARVGARAGAGHSDPIEFITAAAPSVSPCNNAARPKVVELWKRLKGHSQHHFASVLFAPRRNVSVRVHTRIIVTTTEPNQTKLSWKEYSEAGNFINSIVIGPATATARRYVHWHNYGPSGGNMRHCSSYGFDYGSDYGSSCCPKIANRGDNKST